MRKLVINITKKDIYVLFKIYRKTIAYCLIAVVVYSIVDKVANNFATQDVIVAAKDLKAGLIIKQNDLAVKRIPISGIAPNALNSQEIVGKMLSANINAEEQITSSRLIADSKSSTNQKIVGVRIADAELASVIKPGAMIDVVKLSNANGILGGIIAKDVLVVAIAEKKSSFGSSAGFVVMASTSNENALNLAINSGEKLTVLLH